MKEVAKATGVRILEVMAVTEGTITEEGWIRSQKVCSISDTFIY